jgi:hypothetical protein
VCRQFPIYNRREAALGLFMKKECEEIKKVLPKYLRGHVFRIKRGRIERHLDQCVICRSEFEALKQTEETLHILRDINASGGVVGRVKDGMFALGKIKKLLYRPLWIAGIALVAAAAIYYLVTPRQLALEIDSIVKTEPTTSASAVPPDAAKAPASISAPSATAGQSFPATSAAKLKTAPQRPAKSRPAPPRARQLTSTPAVTAVPASPAPEPSQEPQASGPQQEAR